MKFRTKAAGLLLASATLAAQAAPADHLSRNGVTVNGTDRGYSYFVPSKYDAAGFNFVVFALHDNGQTVEDFAERSGWVKLAEENNFVVIFPDVDGKGWAPSSGGEDAYLKAVYDHVATHLMPPAPEGAPAQGAQGGNRGGGGGGGGEAGGHRVSRVPTWPSFQYLTGAGAGAAAAQEFAIDHPGLFAAVATLDGTPYPAAYTHGAEPAQNYLEHLRPGKNVDPVWKQAKKDVPVAVWLFSGGAPSPAQAREAEYWRHADGTAAIAASRSIGGFQTAVYANPANALQEVRVTALPAGAAYDENLSAAIWNEFFVHVARWTSSANGDLGGVLSEAEVNSRFEVRTIDVGGGVEPYKYYLKLPSSYRPGQSLPLVVAAHGVNLPARLYLSQIKMHEVGEKEGFITAYPAGHQNRWDFNKPDGADQRFIERLIDDVATTYGADRGRVYLQGFSFGSGLTYALGITRPDLFAAISPNSGIGPMPKDVETAADQIRAKGFVRLPTMIVYGAVDSASSVDGLIPADGVLRGAIDEIKAYNHLTAPDKVEHVDSANTAPYDALVPGGTLVAGGRDAHYPEGRFKLYRYESADTKPLPLFDFVWVADLTHGDIPQEAQLEWDFFKNWRRNPDGSLSYSGR